MLDPTKPARAGNVYDTMALQVSELARGHHCVATIDASGTVTLNSDQSEGFQEAFRTVGYAGYAGGKSVDHAGLARRLQDAHMAVIKQGLVSE